MTGASRGLGKAIAQRLAAEGATVAFTARTMDPDPKYAGRCARPSRRSGPPAGRRSPSRPTCRLEDRERLFAEVVEQVGAPDILVNNAAVTFLRPLDGFPEKRAK